MRTGAYETQLSFDAALERVENDPEWIRRARFAIAAFCQMGQEFTADEVRLVAGDPPGSGNAFGALFHTIAEEGWILHVGYRKSTRPEAHGRILSVWRAAS